MLGKRKRGGAAAAAAKAADRAFRKVKPVEEITFDMNERHAYLTGFHKRKQQRIKYAQEEAAKQEREEKIQQRKELREERKREIEEHVKAVGKAVRRAEGVESDDESEEVEKEEDNGAGDEWTGIQDGIATKSVDHEDQYLDSDDEEEARVTVEAVNITRDGFEKVDDSDESGTEQRSVDKGISSNEKKEKRVWTKEKPKAPKKKRKKFRYESQAERKLNLAQIRAAKAKKRARREGN